MTEAAGEGDLGGSVAGNGIQHQTVVFDSNVMFDPTRRYALLSLVVAGAFMTRWSRALLDEWIHVIVREQRTTLERATYQREKLLADFPEALVSDIPAAVQAMAAALVNDPGDAMIAACALAVAPCTLLTFNGKDFKRTELRAHGVHVRKPGPWLQERYAALTDEEQHEWCAALDAHRDSLGGGAMTPEAYLDRLGTKERGLGAFVGAARAGVLALNRRDMPTTAQTTGAGPAPLTRDGGKHPLG